MYSPGPAVPRGEHFDENHTGREEVREVMDIRIASDYLGSVLTLFTNTPRKVLCRRSSFGNRWRFKRSRLDEWMDQQSSQGAQPRKTESHPDVEQPRKPQSVAPRQKRAVAASPLEPSLRISWEAASLLVVLSEPVLSTSLEMGPENDQQDSGSDEKQQRQRTVGHSQAKLPFDRGAAKSQRESFPGETTSPSAVSLALA